ncbi:hypothetical protein ACFU5O_17125 [Streptomyces sp. NPDC057445]
MADAQTFAVLPVAVALNADHHLSRLTTHACTKSDPREAYELMRLRR